MCQSTSQQQQRRSRENTKALLQSEAVSRKKLPMRTKNSDGKRSPPNKRSIWESHSIERSGWVDLAAFLCPLLASGLTDVTPVYVTAIGRIVSIRALMSLHYALVDKDDYDTKLGQRQLRREKADYLVAALLHMWIQVALQLIFPTMFFPSTSPDEEEWDFVKTCARLTLLSHVCLVEPLYYFVHRWLHDPRVMKNMHSHHHSSVRTLPSTSLVQDFKEHFVYVATFGPAFFAPFLYLGGRHHWSVICAYLILFDLINAFGHTNFRLHGNWTFDSPWSPLRYLFYTPEFHLGHHRYYKANYGLFMPIWDMMLGTHREFRLPSKARQLPPKRQDFVFIGHNGGLGHLLTCPEFSVYNVYDAHNIRPGWFPASLEFLFMDLVAFFYRCVVKSYSVSRYVVDERFVGRIICVLRTPIDYISKRRHGSVNRDIIKLIEREHRSKGTRYFGLGNLNKMKQLNDGGEGIVKLLGENEYLRDKPIRIWTGDTLTAASVYHQILSIPDLEEIFYVGAGGKIGKAVVRLLAEGGVRVKIFSRYEAIDHPNVSYTQDLHDMADYRHVVVGKLLDPKIYDMAVRAIRETRTESEAKTRYLLDYTVPFLPLDLDLGEGGRKIHHIQIAVLAVGSKENPKKSIAACKGSEPVLRGHFDVCMGHNENEIYPCHTGCILNMLEGREDHEVGDIDVKEVTRLWRVAEDLGLTNRVPRIPID